MSDDDTTDKTGFGLPNWLQILIVLAVFTPLFMWQFKFVLDIKVFFSRGCKRYAEKQKQKELKQARRNSEAF